jgi:type IV pilus assembly protein PilA
VRGLFFCAAHQRESMTSRTAKRDSGFSVTELALVLGTTSIIAALALSAYRTYSVRAEVATAIGGVKRVTHAVEQSFRRMGVPPRTLADLGPPLLPRLELVDEVGIDNGRIKLTFGRAADPSIAGQSLYLTPFETADQRIVWICGNRAPSVGLSPLGFAGGANLAEQARTVIEPRFLPPACR